MRLLLGHPALQLDQVYSTSHKGRPVASVHPNLRGCTDLRFSDLADLRPCDVLFIASRSHGSGTKLAELRQLAPLVIDCGPSLRLRDPEIFRQWYGAEPEPEAVLQEAVYGLPEIGREELRGATLISGAGCSAVAAILALMPLARAGWVLEAPTFVEARFGSSAAGAIPSPGSHHPERAGAVRVFAPVEHRHSAEVAQALGWTPEALSYGGVAVEMVRGVSVSVRCFLDQPRKERDVWEVLRAVYASEPFVRLVAQRTGLHRQPDPRWLAGTNFCDVGFALDRSGRRLTMLAALDNLGKGAAGNAVQSLNCALGFEESAGLGFMGLHPL
jgi:N-acetyl-gamma-glutamyl-phosphate/LysW-gamma-L-alpha-aminoadipyl-6-phosphate reductase